MLKVVVGFLPFTVIFGLMRGVPLWLCLLLPLGIAGAEADGFGAGAAQLMRKAATSTTRINCGRTCGCLRA